jgi:excisionase family DNA binding protein
MHGTEKELGIGMTEAARRLGVSSRTVASLISENRIPSYKIGRRRIVPVAALEAFVNRQFPMSQVQEPRDGEAS